MTDDPGDLPELTTPEQLAAEPPELPPAGGQLLRKVTDNKLAVLGVLFGVTGCLGLPLLFASPRFSASEKGLWAVLNTVYTVLLVAGVVWLCVWAWSRIAPYI